MLEGWTPNQQSLNWSCIVHSWKCLFHLSALFYSEPNNLCLLKMFSDLWFHCQLGKGFGSIHTSFRNRGPLRYNLVKLLLQCTNGTQTQTGGGQRGKGEGPYPLERASRIRRKISREGASLGAASFPGGLHDPVVPWRLKELTHPQKCQRALRPHLELYRVPPSANKNRPCSSRKFVSALQIYLI